MNERPSDLPDGVDARSMLDRSQQAARFLDLTRQRGLGPTVDDEDDDDDLALPLVAAHLRGVMAATTADDAVHSLGSDGADETDDADDDDDDDDDIRIDPSAFAALRPGAVPAGEGLGRFTLDDDGDVFGDGNGFAADPPFGSDGQPF